MSARGDAAEVDEESDRAALAAAEAGPEADKVARRRQLPVRELDGACYSCPPVASVCAHGGGSRADFWFALLQGDGAARHYAPLDALDCGTPLVAGGTAVFHEPETAEGEARAAALFRQQLTGRDRHCSRLRLAAEQPRQPARAARRARLERFVRHHPCGVGGDQQRLVSVALKSSTLCAPCVTRCARTQVPPATPDG